MRDVMVLHPLAGVDRDVYSGATTNIQKPAVGSVNDKDDMYIQDVQI